MSSIPNGQMYLAELDKLQTYVACGIEPRPISIQDGAERWCHDVYRPRAPRSYPGFIRLFLANIPRSARHKGWFHRDFVHILCMNLIQREAFVDPTCADKPYIYIWVRAEDVVHYLSFSKRIRCVREHEKIYFQVFTTPRIPSSSYWLNPLVIAMARN